MGGEPLKSKKILIYVLAISIVLVVSGCVEFVPPTPANNTVTNASFIEVNVSVSGLEKPDAFVFNWNGTGYTIYDYSLALAMNFNNNSLIGEDQSNTVDISRYGSSGNIYGAVHADGKYGKALEFDGQNDYVEVVNEGKTGLIDTGLNGNLTIMAWIKKPAQDGLFDTIVSTEAFRFQIDSSKRIHWGWTDGSNHDWVNSNRSITLNEWHHVVGVKEGNVIRFYIDGNPAGEGTISYTRSISHMRIRKDGLSGIGWIDYFDGIIDDVMIYNRALSQDEVLLHYRSTFC